MRLRQFSRAVPLLTLTSSFNGLMFVPFWWVGAAHSQDTANMKVEQREDKHCSFSVLTNHKAIKPFEALQLYVEAKLEQKA